MSYKDNYYGNILDPIYGQIRISEIEKWIISTKIFSRLRRIRQNTFLYYVFPSANHSRFEHSIGAMYLASRIFESCLKNFSTGRKKFEKYREDESASDFFDLEEGLKGEEEVLYQELRLAALMHDIGHGPMSHKFDDFTLSKENLLEVIKSDKDLNKYYDAFNEKITSNVEHEILSCLFILKLIKKLKKLSIENKYKFGESTHQVISQINEERIVKMIEPDFPTLNPIEINDLDYTDFFSKIISAFPLDADRMDYLLRDSYFSGVKYGIYDLSRIFMSFLAVKDTKTKKVFLSIKESGIDSTIRFIQSRSHLYNQVYFHKTNRAANSMLDFACRELGKNAQILQANTYDQLENFYWNNSDEEFLYKTLKGNIKGEAETETLDELILRKLWKRVYEKKIIILNPPKIKTHEIEISKIINTLKSKSPELEKEGIYIIPDKWKNVVFKDSEKSLKIASKVDGNYHIAEDWKTFNKELSALDLEVIMVRIYLKRNFLTPSEFKEKKARVRDFFANEISMLENIGQ